MYGEADVRCAARQVRKAVLILAAVLLPLLAAYVLALTVRNYPLSIAAALLMTAWCLFAADLLLTPRVRYARFLKALGSGLRRQTRCEILHLEEEIHLQDGARVRQLHVALPDGDSRIFYLNASKAGFLPECGARCTLVSCGRHVVDFAEN